MQENLPDDFLLSRAEVQTHFNLSQRFLEVSACKGGGPHYVKIGRSVRYRAGDVRDWIDAQKVSSTSDTPVREVRL